MKLIRQFICARAGLALATSIISTSAQPVLLNEIYPNPPGNTVPIEFIELKGAPLQALDGYFLLAVHGNPGIAGRADLVLNLNGVLLGTNGLLTVKVSRTNGFIVPIETRVIEDARFIDTAISPLNNNSLSVLLVQSAVAPVETTDYDANDDGVFDVAPLNTATIVDSIGIRQLVTDPVYGGARIPNVGNDNRPEAVVRLFGDTRTRNADAWFAGRMNGSGLTVAFNAQVTTNFPPGATLTPGRENIVFSAYNIVQSGSTTDVDEDGVTDSYTLALGAAPTGQVVVAVTANAQVRVSVDGVNFVSQTNLTFTPGNGTLPQTITVQAVDDALVEAGRTHAGFITNSIASSDDTNTFPTTLPAANVPVNIFDNESIFPIVRPTGETPSAFTPDDSDDAACWIHPTDAARSLLLTTKKLGGATVFDFDLNIVQPIHPVTNNALRLNNVEVVYDFSLNGSPVDLAVFSDRINDTLYIYRIDANASTNPLTLVSADLLTHIFPGSVNGADTAYGLCLYKSPLDGKRYAFVSRSALGVIAQLELYDAGGGQVGWRRVRTITLPDVFQAEGIVADQELGWVYFAQEKVGVWKFPAEPTRASDGGKLIQRVKPAVNALLASDIEGLCIYYGTNGSGYLIVSSQGENNFAVFERQGTNAYLGSFAIGANQLLGIDQITTCDGADVCPLALPNYPQGVLIVQDGENDGSVSIRNTNFKLVPWESVASSFSPALAVTPSGHDPRSFVNRLAPRFDVIQRETDGSVRLSLSGPTGQAFGVQSSTNLTQWNPVTNVTFATPLLHLTNAPSAMEQQFYRLVSP